MLFCGIAGTWSFALTDGKISDCSLTDASEKLYQNLLTAGVAGWGLVKLFLVDEERQTQQFGFFFKFLFFRAIKMTFSLCMPYGSFTTEVIGKLSRALWKSRSY